MDSIKQITLPAGVVRMAGRVRESTVNGEGYRYTIFTQGCPHHCKGCHNPQTHAFSGGEEVATQELLQEALQNPLLSGVTFSGGEPFCQAAALADLAKELHGHDLNVWCYSGYTYEQLAHSEESAVQGLLQQIDVLIDGEYVEEQKDLTLSFRGSANQRIIDVPQSLQRGEAVPYRLDAY